MPILPKLNLAIGKASDAGHFQFEDTSQENQEQKPQILPGERSVSSPSSNIGLMTSNDMSDFDTFDLEQDHHHHHHHHQSTLEHINGGGHDEINDMLLGGEDDENEDHIVGHLLQVENDSLAYLDDDYLDDELDDTSMLHQLQTTTSPTPVIPPDVNFPLITLSNEESEEDHQFEVNSDDAKSISIKSVGDMTPEVQWSRPQTPTPLEDVNIAKTKRPTQSTRGNKRARRLPRTITKLAKDADPEKMPLRERLFYNPPETIYQKENKVNFLLERRGSTSGGSVKSEAMGSEIGSFQGRRRSSSQANSIDSRSSSRSGGSIKRGRMIIESDDEDEDMANNNTRRAGSIKDEDSNSVITINGEDNGDTNSRSQVELVIDEVTGQVVINNPEALAEQARNEAASTANGGLRRVVSEQRTTYSSFRRRRERSKNMWNAEETATFYAALERIGTDFSLMEAIFFKDSTRDRRQLKQKFKREEKINRELIDGILYKQLGK